MKLATCPKCNSVMDSEDGHFRCPQCDMYLSAWAFPFVSLNLKQVETSQEYGNDNEVTANYAIPH